MIQACPSALPRALEHIYSLTKNRRPYHYSSTTLHHTKIGRGRDADFASKLSYLFNSYELRFQSIFRPKPIFPTHATDTRPGHRGRVEQTCNYSRCRPPARPQKRSSVPLLNVRSPMPLFHRCDIAWLMETLSLVAAHLVQPRRLVGALSRASYCKRATK